MQDYNVQQCNTDEKELGKSRLRTIYYKTFAYFEWNVSVIT